MTRLRRLRHHGDRGSTLAEQVIVMLLLSSVMVLVATVTIDLARSSEQHRQRVASLAEQQVALNVVTRDLRAADPLISLTALPCETGRQPPTTPAISACANTLVLELTRQGSRWRITYALLSGTLTRAEQRWIGTAWSTASQRVLARGLLNGAAPSSPVFALTDAAGQPVGTVTDVSRVNALLAARNPRSSKPLTVLAEVTVRNRVSRTAG